MRFISLTSALAMAVGVNAAMSASEVTSNIDAITQKSSETNDAAKSLSVINMFSVAPQVINDFKDIITLATNDITAMGIKRSLHARQECLDVDDIPKCVSDLGEILDDPSEILGGAKKRQNNKKRQEAGYSDSDQQGICTAFRGFVQVHQALLQTVIGKHGLLSLTPFTEPIADVLRTLEGGVDKLAFGIIDLVPTCAQDAIQNKNALDMTLMDAENTYKK